MLRWTVSLAVLVAMLVSSTELMAQRRQPLRNMARQIGVRWSAGYQTQNPGWQTDYYSPWSDINTSGQHFQNGTIIEGNAPVQIAPEQPIDNSATRLLRQPAPINSGIRTPQPIQANPPIYSPYSTESRIQPNSGIDRTISDNQRINQHLTPYHRAPATNSSIQIPSGGQFDRIPNSGQFNRSIPQNQNWNEQFDTSRPFRPGT
ncbi:MAG: hypothetical protein ACR2NP_21010 [Pirellulaceae bacterium]